MSNPDPGKFTPRDAAMWGWWRRFKICACHRCWLRIHTEADSRKRTGSDKQDPPDGADPVLPPPTPSPQTPSGWQESGRRMVGTCRWLKAMASAQALHKHRVIMCDNASHFSSLPAHACTAHTSPEAPALTATSSCVERRAARLTFPGYLASQKITILFILEWGPEL